MGKDDNMNEGLPEHRGLDAAGRAAALQRLEPRAAVKVGNLADLQRYGADGDPSKDPSLAFNPNEDPDSLITPAENDARQGLVTVETDRTGVTKDVEKAVAKAEKDLQQRPSGPANKGSEPAITVDPGTEQPKTKGKA